MGDDHDVRTLWCGNLSPKITDELLFELFLQAGPVERVSIPKDKDGKLRSYGFVTFKHEASVLYAIQVMEGTSLHGRSVAMKNRKLTEQSQSQRNSQPYGRQQQQQQAPSYVNQASLLPAQQLNAFSVLALQGMYQQQQQYQQTAAHLVPHYQQQQQYQQQYQGTYPVNVYQARQQERHQGSNSYQQRSSQDRTSYRSRQDRQDRQHRDEKPYSRSRHRR